MRHRVVVGGVVDVGVPPPYVVARVPRGGRRAGASPPPPHPRRAVSGPQPQPLLFFLFSGARELGHQAERSERSAFFAGWVADERRVRVVEGFVEGFAVRSNAAETPRACVSRERSRDRSRLPPVIDRAALTRVSQRLDPTGKDDDADVRGVQTDERPGFRFGRCAVPVNGDQDDCQSQRRDGVAREG